MSESVSKMIREYIFGLSLVTLIIGGILVLFGILGIWMKQVLVDLVNVSNDVLIWAPYILIIGFILLVAGIWYCYDYLRNKKRLLEDLQTNKRSEFCKNHAALKNAAKRLPSKYQEMLAEKEKELRVK